MARKKMNTRMGGHAALTRVRQIIADPNGNREQRRAAKRLGVTSEPSEPAAEVPTDD